MNSYLLHGDRFYQNDIYYYINPTLSYAQGIIDAIARWDSLLSVDFYATTTRFGSDIYFTEGFMDGPNGTLGLAQWFTNGAGSVSRSTVTFDSGENFTSTDIDLYKVALHEIGHVLGLDHPNDPGVLMNAFLPNFLTDLAPGDIAGAQYIYGSEDGTVLPGGVTAGWNYTYAYIWKYGWNVGWTYGWTYGWHQGWYVEYTPDEFVFSWQITGKTWGWTLGWGWLAYVDSTGGQSYYYGYGYYSDLVDQWEYVGAWTYTTAWVFGWTTGWHQAWHVGWNLSWHQTWGWGWVYQSAAAQISDTSVSSGGHSHTMGCSCYHCLGEPQSDQDVEEPQFIAVEVV
ncbi:MAG: matrixin family metalloprotease [Pseudomonadota bacterium]